MFSSSSPPPTRFFPALSDADHLVQIAEGHLARLRSDLGPLLQETWDEIRRRRFGTDSPAGTAYFHPIAQPILLVPIWAAEAARNAGSGVAPEVVDDAVGASVLGYHAVRLQDDFVDEGRGEATEILLLSTAVLSRAQALLARRVTSPVFWDWYSLVMTRYAAAMAMETGLRAAPSSYDRAAFEQVLERSQPLAVPGAALLAHAQRWEVVPVLEELVRAITFSLQLSNDLRHARHDLAFGNITWVHRLLGWDEGSPDMSRRALLSGVDMVFQETIRGLARAHRAAVLLGSEHAALWVESASAYLQGHVERVIVATLGRRVGVE